MVVQFAGRRTRCAESGRTKIRHSGTSGHHNRPPYYILLRNIIRHPQLQRRRLLCSNWDQGSIFILQSGRHFSYTTANPTAKETWLIASIFNKVKLFKFYVGLLINIFQETQFWKSNGKDYQGNVAEIVRRPQLTGVARLLTHHTRWQVLRTHFASPNIPRLCCTRGGRRRRRTERETTPEEAMWLGYVVSAKKEKKKEFSPFRRWWCGIFPTKSQCKFQTTTKIASYRRLMNERLLNVDRGRWGTFMSNNIVSKIWQLFREKSAGRSVILLLALIFLHVCTFHEKH